MSKLPRYQPDQKVTGKDLNVIIAALDAGGLLNLSSQTGTGITGQGLAPTVPTTTSGSTTPAPGSVGAPQTPTGLTYQVGIDYYSQTHDGFVVLSWTPNPVYDFVSRYDIYYHKGADDNLHNLTVGGDVSSVRINSLIPGQTYVFAIQAHDAANRASNFSMELPVYVPLDIDPPAVPTGLAATTVGDLIRLTWTEVGVLDGISNDLKEYQIAVSTDGGSTYPTTYTVGPGNSWLYIPTVATPFFKIASVDWTGNVSAYSAAVSATAGGTIVGPITINPGPIEISGGPLWTTDSWVKNLKIDGVGVIELGGGNATKFGIGANSSNLYFFTTTVEDTSAGPSYWLITSTSGVPTFQNAVNVNGLLTAGANLSVTGTVTTTSAVSIPPSAGGTIAPTSYGTVRNKLTETILGATTATVSFSSIPTNGRLLTFQCSVRDNSAGTSGDQFNIQFNSDSGANYTYGGNFTSNAGSNFPFGSTSVTSGRVGFAVQNGIAAGLFDAGLIELPNYSSTTQRRVWLYRQFRMDGSIGSEVGGGEWANTTTAITTVTFSLAANSFVSGSQFVCWVDY